MNEKRRRILKQLMSAACAMFAGRISLGSHHPERYPLSAEGNEAGTSRTGTFPFTGFIRAFSIGEFIPKDQGGKFIQEELPGTECDEQIVREIRGGMPERVFGNPVDWGKLESTELEKSVWLNRFYYLPSFARMYYLKKDQAALGYMVRFIRKWIAENPGGGGNSRYNWFDMQVAWRAIHLSWCYFLGEGGLTADEKKMITGSLQVHADILLEGFGKQNLNEFNHQAHGALAMLYLGILFPFLRGSEELVSSGLRILDHHIRHAFYTDGGNVEQMFGYYPFEAHLFRDAYLLCRANQVEFPEELAALLQRMIRFMVAVKQPDHTMPPVNDSFEMPAIPTIATLCAVLGQEAPAGPGSSVYFPETQIAVMRAEKGRHSWYVLINPAKSIGAHAHAGRLAFTLWINGRPLLIDSGCCNYDRPLLVRWYRTTRAHNTVVIDGKSDEATSSARQWAPKRITGNRITRWVDHPDYRWCRMNSPTDDPVNSGVSWTRDLVLVKNEFFVIHDCFESSGEHRYETLFHFPPTDVSTGDHQEILTGSAGPVIVPVFEKMPDCPVISNELVSSGGKDIPAPVASYHFIGKGTSHSAFVVIPEPEKRPLLKCESSGDGFGIMISGVAGKAVLSIITKSLWIY